jgi:hypothetical protein
MVVLFLIQIRIRLGGGGIRIIFGSWTRIRIIVKSWVRIRIRIEVETQKLYKFEMEPCRAVDALNGGVNL